MVLGNSVFAKNTTIFAQNTTTFAQNTNIFAQNTTVIARAVFPHLYLCRCVLGEVKGGGGGIKTLEHLDEDEDND